MSDQHDDDRDHESRRPAVIGLLLVLGLVVAGYFLATALHRNSQLEDCLMSGRANCNPIELPLRQ